MFKANNKDKRNISDEWVQKELQRHDNKQFKIDIKGTRKIYLKSTMNTLKQCFENQ